jgi:hypothetical protein
VIDDDDDDDDTLGRRIGGRSQPKLINHWQLEDAIVLLQRRSDKDARIMMRRYQ